MGALVESHQWVEGGIGPPADDGPRARAYVYWLIASAVCGAYFIYSATGEERNMTTTFPTTYPSYRTQTKMLIPFLL